MVLMLSRFKIMAHSIGSLPNWEEAGVQMKSARYMPSADITRAMGPSIHGSHWNLNDLPIDTMWKLYVNNLMTYGCDLEQLYSISYL